MVMAEIVMLGIVMFMSIYLDDKTPVQHRLYGWLDEALF